ncbi:MAG: aminotransferase class IV [Deltaproteobacteria bacterium]|nr:aminotransferase class IV [Deltaproteobacteria bacterium]
MLEDRIVYLNGEFLPWGQATVHMMSHSFSRGSAIFEVLSLHETPSGPAVFRLDEHLDRFFRSAELLGMTIPSSKGVLGEAISETVRKNGVREGTIKVLGYYSQVAFEILPPPQELDIAVFVVVPSEDLGGFKAPHSEGSTLCVSKWRKLDPQTVPIEAKAAANYLNGMMARKEALEKGFDFTVMLDTQGFLAEGGTESIFLVKDGVLLTPSEGTVLKSITRKSIIEAGKTLGIEVREGRFPPELLQNAEEIFFSCTPMKVLPVKRCEERILSPIPGAVTGRISALLNDIVAGKDERFAHWLFPVG